MPYCMFDWFHLQDFQSRGEDQIEYLLDCLLNIIYDYYPIANFWKNLDLQNFALQNHS